MSERGWLIQMQSWIVAKEIIKYLLFGLIEKVCLSLWQKAIWGYNFTKVDHHYYCHHHYCFIFSSWVTSDKLFNSSLSHLNCINFKDNSCRILTFGMVYSPLSVKFVQAQKSFYPTQILFAAYLSFCIPHSVVRWCEPTDAAVHRKT